MLRRNFAKPALAFALFAMVLRAILPAGWMPNPAGASGTPFIICTMDGPKRMAPPPGPSHAPDDGTSRDHGPCTFAAAATLAPPALPPVLVAPPAVSEHAQTPDAVAAFVAPHRTAHTPRAPPSLA